MTKEETKKLKYIVGRMDELRDKIDELKAEQKELAESAWKQCAVKAKVVKQLLKETRMDIVKRKARQLEEESLDQCRNALGMLADLPLGEHAQERHKRRRQEAHAH